MYLVFFDGVLRMAVVICEDGMRDEAVMLSNMRLDYLTV
jgi:hypothetical protein